MPIQNSSHYVGQTKQAGLFGDPGADGAADRSRYLAAHALIRAIIGAGGVGLLGGAAFGAGRMLSQPKPYQPEPSFQSVDVALPEEHKRDKLAGAAELLDGAAPRSIADTITNAIAPHIPHGMGGFWGDHASTPWAIPALYTLGIPAIAAAGYGGFKATQSLTDTARKTELAAQLAATKKQYGKYVRHALTNKQAGDLGNTIEHELDELASLCEKKAGDSPGGELAKLVPSLFYHGSNLAQSAYYPFALLSALTTGKLSYDYFKKRSPEAVNEEALRRRAKERAGGASPIYMTPAPGGNPV